MEEIKFGFKPRDMDDRWLMYYVESEKTLYVHRSCTGACIFIVYGFDAVSAVVNDDPDEYRLLDHITAKSDFLDFIGMVFEIQAREERGLTGE